MLTSKQFLTLFPKVNDPDTWVSSLIDILPKYTINTNIRIAAFLSQCGVESGGFTRWVENLNYSVAGLLKTWPTRFNSKNVGMYARQPEKIANKVYANRLGNGDEASGDGWKYRGIGLIQLTGKATCQAFAKTIGYSLDTTMDYLMTPKGALESACWFWKLKGLNSIADTQDIKAVSKKVNGGYIGLTERENLYKAVLKELS